LIKALQQLTLENDSLKRHVVLPLHDSIVNLNNNINKINNEVIHYKKTLKNDSANIFILQQKIETLNDNRFKKDRDSLQRMVDSLSIKVSNLENTVKSKEKIIFENIEIANANANTRFNNGKQEIVNQLVMTYQIPFTDLIKLFNLNLIERDRSLILGNSQVQKKINDLEVFYKSEIILNEKYNEINIEHAIQNLNKLEQSEIVSNLINKLKMYRACYNGLIDVFEQVVELDKAFIANDGFTQKEKYKKILLPISEYLRDYRFDFKSYPFLSSILLEVINVKQADANANISVISNKL
jgi:hypothetical protein